MKKFDKIGLAVPKVLLPNKNIDLSKWAVIACDQFTSDPNYWEEVKKYVGNSFSTLNLIIPEIYLETLNMSEAIDKINSEMSKYVKEKVFDEYEGLIYVERKLANGKVRKGLMALIDLDQYDYEQDSVALMRATEKTVLERIPPRVEIRKNAPIEIPHVMVLIDDPSSAVIQLRNGKPIYDFELMMGGGRITGYLIDDEKEIEKIANNLEKLGENGFLYAVGDGNHSLASAKECWEKLKDEMMEVAGDPDSFCDFLENHEARYVLVELVNLYDESLDFEPIHRVLFNVDKDEFLKKIEGGDLEIEIVIDGEKKKIKTKNEVRLLIDDYVRENPLVKIDFIHEEETVIKLSEGKNIGILLPSVKKENLFSDVLKNGPYPRKTFSMGEGRDKRYYLEARKIRKI